MAKIEVNQVELVWPGKYNEDGALKEVPYFSTHESGMIALSTRLRNTIQIKMTVRGASTSLFSLVALAGTMSGEKGR